MRTMSIFKTFFKKNLIDGGLCPSVLPGKSLQITDMLQGAMVP